jgi:sugar lactone lactonase YvrE
VRSRPAQADRVSIAAALALVAALALYLWWPLGTAAAPSGRLAVADLRGRALVLVDLERPGEAQRVPLPAPPHELVELADGRVVASLDRRGALAVVSPDAAAVEFVRTGGAPHGLAIGVGRAGETLYVTDRSRDLVRRFSTRDWSEGEPLPAGATPHDVGVLPGGTLAIANAGDSTLQLGGRALAVSALPESIATSDRRVAVAGAHGGALEVFVADGTLVDRAELGGRPVRVVFDGAGSRLAAALSASGEVALVDAHGEVRRVSVGGVPDGLAFTADGRWLLAGDLTTGAMWVIDVRSGEVTGRLQVGESTGALLLLAAAW